MKNWTGLLEQARPLVGTPSFLIFTDLLTGWICVPGRRTITAMVAVADPTERRAYDACHRFVRDGAQKMSGLWRVLTIHVVARHGAAGVIELLCDDTLFLGVRPESARCRDLPRRRSLHHQAGRLRDGLEPRRRRHPGPTAVGRYPDRTADQRPPPQWVWHGSGPQLIHRGTLRADTRPTWHYRPSPTGCNSPETHCHPHDLQHDEHPLNPHTPSEAITPAPKPPIRHQPPRASSPTWQALPPSHCKPP